MTGRVCIECGGPLPAGSTPRRMYCSGACRTRACKAGRTNWGREAGGVPTGPELVGMVCVSLSTMDDALFAALTVKVISEYQRRQARNRQLPALVAAR